MKLFSTEEFNSGLDLLSTKNKNDLLTVLKFLTDNGKKKIIESPKVVSISNDVYSFLSDELKVYFKINENKIFLINFVLSGNDTRLNDYLTIMESIRIGISDVNKSIRLNYPVVSIYAQLRFVLELMSKSWLVVNEEIASRNSSVWNVNQIITLLSKENSNFYQQAVLQENGEVNRLVNKSTGFLSLDDFKKAYNVCNGKIHTNIKEDESDYKYIQEVVNELSGLLETHVIYPKNRKMFYFVGMNGKDGKPFGNTFKQA
ncbi:hypothetical protein [Vibrio harveyi]